MEELVKNLLTQVNLILAGLPLKWDSIPQQSRQDVVTCALHCVLNGPVGVGKRTHFPLIDREIAINTLIKTSNKSWKGFCREIAVIVKRSAPDIECNTKTLCGDFWPLRDWPLKDQDAI
jgi:hypothetical protein